MANDDVWRKFVNGLEIPEFDGEGVPMAEKIQRDSPNNYTEDNVIVYKMTTEVYVYQHIGSDSWFGANTLQDVSILGEMTLDQARKLVQAKKLRRKKS